MPDGTLVDPGTSGTLKIDNTIPGDSSAVYHDVGGDPIYNTVVDNPIYIPGGNGNYGYSTVQYKMLTAKEGVSIPDILKILNLFPIDANYQSETVFVCNYGTRVLFAGGGYSSLNTGGLCNTSLSLRYIDESMNGGFREAFIPDLA
jgi:hypothetical protein